MDPDNRPLRYPIVPLLRSRQYYEALWRSCSCWGSLTACQSCVALLFLEFRGLELRGLGLRVYGDFLTGAFQDETGFGACGLHHKKKHVMCCKTSNHLGPWVPFNRGPFKGQINLPLVSREWRNGSNSSYNCTPVLHSLLPKGKLTDP